MISRASTENVIRLLNEWIRMAHMAHPQLCAQQRLNCRARTTSPTVGLTSLDRLLVSYSASKFNERGVSIWRKLILAAGLFACLIPASTFAQEHRKTVTIEVYLPEGTRLF